MAVDRLDPCGIYFGTTGGQVYASPDSGDSWAPISTDLTNSSTATISAFAVAPTDSRVLYAGTSNGRLSFLSNWLTPS